MAKSRKSVFNTGKPQAEVKREAKQIEKKVLGSPTPPQADKGKRKFLYVNAAHHSIAKQNAAKMGMKLGEYIEFLIDGHTP